MVHIRYYLVVQNLHIPTCCCCCCYCCWSVSYFRTSCYGCIWITDICCVNDRAIWSIGRLVLRFINWKQIWAIYSFILFYSFNISELHDLTKLTSLNYAVVQNWIIEFDNYRFRLFENSIFEILNTKLMVHFKQSINQSRRTFRTRQLIKYHVGAHGKQWTQLKRKQNANKVQLILEGIKFGKKGRFSICS